MRVLVTGGGGFLGRHVCARLRAGGDDVVAFHRHPYPELEAEQRLGDLRDAETVSAAVAECAAVVHCGGKAGLWGPPAEYHDINVLGTRNVIAACLEHGVRRLVYTSSPSVVHNGRDLDGVDESVPYATRFRSPYPESKAAAERLVLAANSADLATVALRPHLIWGPGDPHFLPRLTERVRAGRFRHIGRPKLIDTVHVDNAADAHLLALRGLEPGAVIAGKAYFIAQGEPLPADFVINGLLFAAGLPPESRRVPRLLARLAAAVVERVHRGDDEPEITRFLVDQLSTAHWFDLTAARTELGYRPRVSALEGLAALAATH